MSRGRAGASTGSVGLTIEVQGLRPLLRDLNKLPKDLQAQLRDASLAISTDLARDLKAAAAASPTPQAGLMPVTPRRDRLVKVIVGGPRRVGRPYRARPKGGKGRGRTVRAKAGALLWGSETGSESGTDRAGRRYTSRFVAGRDPSGHWVAPTVTRAGPAARTRWLAAVDAAADTFARGG